MVRVALMNTDVGGEFVTRKPNNKSPLGVHVYNRVVVAISAYRHFRRAYEFITTSTKMIRGKKFGIRVRKIRVALRTEWFFT